VMLVDTYIIPSTGEKIYINEQINLSKINTFRAFANAYLI